MNIFTISYFILKVTVDYLVIRHFVIIDQIFPRVELWPYVQLTTALDLIKVFTKHSKI